MPRRRYSDEERAAALAALRANGGNAKLTARQAGVPESTLKRWRADPDMAGSPDLRAGKIEELSVIFERVARAYLGQAEDEGVVKATRGKDAVIAAATAADKQLLLRGKPTNITETRHLDTSRLSEDEALTFDRLLDRASVAGPG